MSQREKAALLWLKKFPLKDMLSKDDLMAGAEKVLNGFSGEVLNGVLRHCPDPVIRIVPRRIKAPALLREMDKKKTIPNQRDGKVWAPELWDDVESDSLKLGITNRTALPFDPTIYYSNYTPDTPEEELELRTNEEMVAEYKHRFAADNLDLMPRYGYLPNMAGNLAEGKVLDAETWTAFERPQDASWLPRASWFNAHVVLNVVSPDNSNRNLRCLPWAEGEM